MDIQDPRKVMLWQKFYDIGTFWKIIIPDFMDIFEFLNFMYYNLPNFGIDLKNPFEND